MTLSNEEIIQQAIADVKAGDNATARQALSNLVEQDPGNARAWYLLSQVVEEPQNAIACLERVLELQPGNEQASRRLERLQFPDIVPLERDQALRTGKEATKSSNPLIIAGITIIPLILCVVCMGCWALTTGSGIAAMIPFTIGQRTVAENTTILSIDTPTPGSKLEATTISLPTAADTITSLMSPTSVYAARISRSMHAECVPLNTQVDEGVVSRIIDGDTIEVLINGQPYRIRYIGMDTPDTNHPTKGLERLGLEAAEMNRQMVEGKPVLLVKDVSETDRYDRLLRYIIVDENNAVFVNYELARQGYAYASSYPPDVACDQTFLVAHQSAMQEKIGLWAPTPIPSLTPASRLPEVTSVAPITGSDCDPAYPTVCIPPSPPDLDCGDIPHRRFQVLPPDPHNFDGDHDGVGCES